MQNKSKINDYTPEILGMNWTPGNLVLVGSLTYSPMYKYVLGNVIVQGTKDQIPIALFSPNDDANRLRRRLMRMQLGKDVFDNGLFSSKDIKDLLLYVDCAFHLTISYLVSQIFRLVEEKEVQGVIINRLQDIDGSLLCNLPNFSKEKEKNAVLRILKAMAESLNIVIIVTTDLPGFNYKAMPTIRDVSELEEHCDQIILFHPLDSPVSSDCYKMILPWGHPFHDKKYGELVLNVVLDSNNQCFKLATTPFDVDCDKSDDMTSESLPSYSWYIDKSSGDWHFDFIDSDGMGWTLALDLLSADETDSVYRIIVYNWAGDEIVLDDYVTLDDINLIKTIALDKVRKKFPGIDIPERDNKL